MQQAKGPISEKMFPPHIMMRGYDFTCPFLFILLSGRIPLYVPLLYLIKKSLNSLIYNRLRIKALFVRAKGLEPIRTKAPDPKSGLATNYNTPAP